MGVPATVYGINNQFFWIKYAVSRSHAERDNPLNCTGVGELKKYDITKYIKSAKTTPVRSQETGTDLFSGIHKQKTAGVSRRQAVSYLIQILCPKSHASPRELNYTFIKILSKKKTCRRSIVTGGVPGAVYGINNQFFGLCMLSPYLTLRDITLYTAQDWGNSKNTTSPNILNPQRLLRFARTKSNCGGEFRVLVSKSSHHIAQMGRISVVRSSSGA